MWGSRRSARKFQARSLPRLGCAVGLCSIAPLKGGARRAALNLPLIRSGHMTPRSRALPCGSEHVKGNKMNKKPTLIAYAVKQRGNEQKAIWTRIGAAWPHANGGKGFSIELEAFPVDGRLVLIEPKEVAEDSTASGGDDA
jgi:hypothetical protein